jgi:type I restriction modification DNA specificity protein
MEYYSRIRAFERYTSGSTIAHLPQEDLRNLPIPLPPIAEQQKIVTIIEEQFSRLDVGIASLTRSQKGLDLARTSSLQTLVSESTMGCRKVLLGDLIASGPQNGLYLPASRYGSGLPILRITDFQNEWLRLRGELKLAKPDPGHEEAFTITVGDLIINRVNSMSHLGKCLAAGADLDGVLFESNMMRLHLHDEADPDFVSMYLRSPQGRLLLLKNAKQAVNQASINQADVRAVSIAIPPLKTQKETIGRYRTFSESTSQMTSEVDLAVRRAKALRTSVLAAAFSGKLI